MNKEVTRCSWCGDDPLYVRYHDEEWGKAVHDDRTFFEFLTLEGAQAGLSWITILRKRENYRKLFSDWNIQKISTMSDEELEKILLDPGVVRNRQKIFSVRRNAKIALDLQKEFGSLERYFWKGPFLEGQSFPIIYSRSTLESLPSSSELSKKISKDLQKRGMNFVGPTIIYAFMQAVGIIDDHLNDCSFKSSL